MSCPKSRLFWRSMGKFSSRLPKAVYDAVADEDFVWCRYWSGSEGSRGAAWEDPEFPPSWRALGDKRKVAGVQWLRPHVSTAITSTSIWLSLSRPSGSTGPALHGEWKWRTKPWRDSVVTLFLTSLANHSHLNHFFLFGWRLNRNIQHRNGICEFTKK